MKTSSENILILPISIIDNTYLKNKLFTGLQDSWKFKTKLSKYLVEFLKADGTHFFVLFLLFQAKKSTYLKLTGVKNRSSNTLFIFAFSNLVFSGPAVGH